MLNLFTTNVNDYHLIFSLLDWQAINGRLSLYKLAFVGGVSDNFYGMAMMDTASHNLTAQRSWHFYDDAIVALATNLTLATTTTPWTTLASRLLPLGRVAIGFFNSSVITLVDGNYSFPYVV